MNIFQTSFSFAVSALIGLLPSVLNAQAVTYLPYIQPGDAGPFGASDQMIVAWQTNETTPHPPAYSVWVAGDADFKKATQVLAVGRVVDNYLAADAAIFGALAIPTAYGAHTDYYALLSGLKYDMQYFYRVTGPGLPADGFTASFHTRTRHSH